MSKPWLSIGMIVKNEIRSIEKCLKALQPLRDTFPCELVIADTGSTDGTREIAEKYADILFDFEWINDFAAARNAVMNRCSGEWYFSIDADEYLDEDLSGFYELKKKDKKENYKGGYVTIVNYCTPQMDKDISSSFLGQRLARLTKEVHYVGSIHECFVFPGGGKGIALPNIILHHDGYVYISKEEAVKKAKRNLDLLDEELKNEPKDTRRWMQCLESAVSMPERRGWYAKEAMKVLIEKDRDTKTPLVDAALAARCIEVAVAFEFSETDEWIKWLDDRYPNALVTRIDAGLCEIEWNVRKERYEEVIRLVDIYLKAVEDWEAKRCEPGELTAILILHTMKMHKDTAHCFKSVALAKLDRQEDAFDALKAIHFEDLQDNGLIAWIKTMLHLLDSSRAVEEMARAEEYFTINSDLEKEDEKWKANQKTFFAIGVKSFLYTDKQSDGVERPWRIYRRCKGILGQNARIMLSEEYNTIEKTVNEITEWQYVPSVVLTRIFKMKIEFPKSFYEQNTIWRAQVIKNIISEDEEFAKHILEKEDKLNRSLVYIQFRLDLLSAALQDQKNFKQEEDNLVDQLNERFYDLIRQYFERIYNEDFIKNDSEWDILPGMSCFMLYLLQAEKQRQSGDSTGYIHTLRKALQKAEGMKYFVEYLAEKEMDQQKMQQASPELLQLADKVKAILSQYPEDDPAVQQLKSSEVYQKVAWLIEQPSTNYEM